MGTWDLHSSVEYTLVQGPVAAVPDSSLKFSGPKLYARTDLLRVGIYSKAGNAHFPLHVKHDKHVLIRCGLPQRIKISVQYLRIVAIATRAYHSNHDSNCHPRFHCRIWPLRRGTIVSDVDSVLEILGGTSHCTPLYFNMQTHV